EQVKHALAVADVDLDHAEVGVAFQPALVGPLAARIVIIVEIVESDDLVAPLAQLLGQVAANEPGRACYKYFHLLFSCSAGRISWIISSRFRLPFHSLLLNE